MGSYVRQRWFSCLATLAGLCGAACGGRSSFLEPVQSESAGAEAVAEQAGSGLGGGSTFGGRGGQGQGGAFSTSGSGGASGGLGQGGKLGPGGQPGVCELALADCTTEKEPECALVREPCRGTRAAYASFDSTQLVRLNDVAPERAGGAVVTGYHVGTTQFGNFSLTSPTLPSQASGQQAVVITVDGNAQLEDLWSEPGPTHTQGISVTQADGTDIMLLLRHPDSATTGLARLDGKGNERWRQTFGVTASLTASALATDNDDRTWVSGDFKGALDYPEITLVTAAPRSSFLLQVDSESVPKRAFSPSPDSWAHATAPALTVDDEDSVIVGGRGDTDPGVQFAYVRKFASSGDLVFEKFYQSVLQPKKVVVDRLMRVTVLGNFAGAFENEGQRFVSNGTLDLWLAQYSREGELLWQKSYEGHAVLVTAAVDPFGNLLLAGEASRLKVGGRELLSQHVTELGHAGFGYVLKLRADGTDVWARTTDGQMLWTAVATNDAGQVWLTGSYTNRIWMGEEELTSASPSGSALLMRLNP